MSQNAQGVIELGKHYPGTMLQNLLGQRLYFTKTQKRTTHLVGARDDQIPVYGMYVKNSSGGALLPGSSVTFAAAGVGTVIDSAGGAGPIAGFVDGLLPAAGVPDGRCFMILQWGRAYVIGAGALSAGDRIEAAASGKVTTLSTGERVGQLIDAISGDGVLGAALIDVRL